MDKKKTTVLIVDDSASARELLTYIINKSPSLEVIGCVENGEKALEFIKQRRPDVITMDVIMPKLDGFETTRRIMQQTPIPILIISSSYNPEDVTKSFQAIDAGSLGIIKKPSGPMDPDFPIISKVITETLINIADVKMVARRHKRHEPVSKTTVIEPIEIIGIGASLGGPQALKMILSQLPKTFGLPIFIVQHISQGFVQGFVDWLNDTTSLTVKLATQGYYAQPGEVIIAPDGFHLEVAPGRRVSLLKGEPEEHICPSVSRLFKSIANVYAQKGAGVILTGMGRDGVDELLLLKQKGGHTIAQHEDGCTMYGMPKEAIAIGAAKHIIHLDNIADSLLQLGSAVKINAL